MKRSSGEKAPVASSSRSQTLRGVSCRRLSEPARARSSSRSSAPTSRSTNSPPQGSTSSVSGSPLNIKIPSFVLITAQVEDDEPPVVEHAFVASAQVCGERRVMFEPPERGPAEGDEACAALAPHPLKLADGRLGVGGRAPVDASAPGEGKRPAPADR